MPVTVHGSVLTTSITIGASPRNNVFTSAVLSAGDILVIVEAMNGAVAFPTGSTPTGGTGLSWTQIVDEQNTASHFSRVTAWWSAVPSDQTSTITCAITSSSNISGAAALYRLSGALASPAGQTNVFQGQTDPTGTSLQITGTLPGSLIIMGASDWSASTAALTVSISGTTGGTTDLNSLESGQFRGVSASGAQSSSTNQGTLDYSAATGDWAAILFEIKAAPTGADANPPMALPPGLEIGPTQNALMLMQLPLPVQSFLPWTFDNGAAAIAAQTVSPASIDDTDLVGQTTLTLTLAPIGITSSEQSGNPTLTPGAVTLSPAGIPSSEAVGNPALASVTIISPAGIPSSETVGQATLTQTLAPLGIGTGETLGQPGLIQTLAPAGIPTAAQLGLATLAQAVAPIGIGTGETVGQSVLTPGTATLAPVGIGTGEQVGNPAVAVVAPQTLAPAGIGSSETVGQAALGLTLAPAAVPPTDAVGQATLTQTLAPLGILTGAQAGNPVLTPGTVTISPLGIPSGEQVGQSTVAGLGASVNPAGIGTSEAVGQSQLTPGTVTITPLGIASGETVGLPNVGLSSLRPVGIGSSEQTGFSSLAQALAPLGIGSGERAGNPTLTPGAVTLAPLGIGSAEQVGRTLIALGQALTVVGIRSGELVGMSVISVGVPFAPLRVRLRGREPVGRLTGSEAGGRLRGREPISRLAGVEGTARLRGREPPTVSGREEGTP